MTTTNQRREINSGPSREELFDALRLRHEGRAIPFTVSPPKQRPGSRIRVLNETFNVQVNSVGIEDGSGNCWLLTLDDYHEILGSSCLSAYYNTRTRTGWVQVA